MKKTILTIALCLVILLNACQRESNPVNTAAGKQEKSIKESEIILQKDSLYSCLTNYTSENYKDYFLTDSISFNTNDVYKIEFDYLVIENGSFYSNNLQFGNLYCNAFIFGKVESSNYEFKRFTNTFQVEQNYSDKLILRIAIQYSNIVYIIKNLKIYKL